MAEQLAHAVFGISDAQADHANGELKLLSRTANVTLQTAGVWRNAAPLEPRPTNGRVYGETIGIFNTPEHDFIAARARYANGDSAHPLYSYTHVPRPVMRDLKGNIDVLFLEMPDRDSTLPSTASIMTDNAWDAAQRQDALKHLLTLCDADFTQVLALLNAAISSERLLITQHEGETAERTQIVRGLMALLPAQIRADLTFSTYTPSVTDTIKARVVFGTAKQTTRHVVNWAEARAATLHDVTWSPYIELLAGLWRGNVAALLDMIDELDPLAERLPGKRDTITMLTDITGRHLLKARVQAADGAITTDDIKGALREPERIPEAWRALYADTLLHHALENRDTEANSMIANQMDMNPDLDADLQNRMNAMLDETPDLVYVFMRQRLSEGISPRWQRRLQNAARHSLSVAISSQDTALIASWLRLLAREPEKFQLDEILHDGMLQSVPQAKQDSAFALDLLVIAARFAAPVLDELLADEELINALPQPFPAAFLSYDRDALAELQSQSTSLFLAGMMRAAQAQAGAAFEAGALERIWQMDKGEAKYNENAPYTPHAILQVCAETGAAWLPSSAIETLLTAVLAEKDEDLFPRLTKQLARRGVLGVHLSGALIRSGSDVSSALDTVSMLVAGDKLTAADAVAVYVTLLEAWGWNAETQPIMETAARLMMQNPDISVATAMLNRMLDAAAALRDEPSARAAALRLLRKLQGEDDEVFVEQIKRVFGLLAWSTLARAAVLKWWREFAQAQPTARLTRLDKALEGTRVTEDALQTLRSVSALRRLIGKRDVATFAQDVNTAYDVLETLAEAFEPSDKSGHLSFEPETVREVLADMLESLSPHQRQILSNSLKGLANLIAQMGDNRSKAGLGRRTDNLDRQFMTGEQTPQSAVDAMKWIAGYFSGAQDSEKD